MGEGAGLSSPLVLTHTFSCTPVELAVTPDQRVRGAVVSELRLGRVLQFGNDPLREHLAELDTPLVERIDLPDRTLGEHVVFIECNKLAEGGRREAIEQEHV